MTKLWLKCEGFHVLHEKCTFCFYLFLILFSSFCTYMYIYVKYSKSNVIVTLNIFLQYSIFVCLCLSSKLWYQQTEYIHYWLHAFWSRVWCLFFYGHDEACFYWRWKNCYVKRVTIIYLTFNLKVKNVFRRAHLTTILSQKY